MQAGHPAMYTTPDMVSVFGVLSLLDRQNNDLSRLNAEPGLPSTPLRAAHPVS